MAADNKTLGRFILDGIPPAPRGMPADRSDVRHRRERHPGRAGQGPRDGPRAAGPHYGLLHAVQGRRGQDGQGSPGACRGRQQAARRGRDAQPGGRPGVPGRAHAARPGRQGCCRGPGRRRDEGHGTARRPQGQRHGCGRKSRSSELAESLQKVGAAAYQSSSAGGATDGAGPENGNGSTGAEGTDSGDGSPEAEEAVEGEFKEV